MGEKRRRLAAGRNPDDAALEQAARSRALFAQGAFGPALEHLAVALERSPHLDPLWAQFADFIRFYNLRDPLPPRLRTLLERALEHPAVDPGDLVRPISSAALSRAGNPLDEPLLLRLMRDTVIRDPALEDAIVAARRDPATSLETLVAIAHQCFNTEYVFDDDGFAPPAPANARSCALYAAYKPLPFPDGAPASLVKQQIEEPAEEARLRATIPSLGEPASAVSAKVRAQYEENPYPRWVRVPAQPAVSEGPRRILIAGCGTGQHAIATARHRPNARVLAIDLSLASLAYAKRKSLELGVTNIEYRQADLLSLHSSPERFEQIEASGVLHHLEDPYEGWRVLAGLLAPGARMRIGLYSERGRRHVVRARELIAKEGFAPTPAGIRACRAAIRARAADELFARFLKSEDFYSMSGCRDLLFHVQEHRFALPQIADMLRRLGLEFAGFEFADAGISAARYRERFPGDASMMKLENWDQLEAEYPDTFARMYQFWVRR
ncbi:MAG TPA: class I SAM-dependent methyltransferase [Burkholderiales bacterium]|nr:class I SAM-dependent methyltransferase [Burkholderiales bacterium]